MSMNNTNELVKKWCNNLYKEGLITRQDKDKCLLGEQKQEELKDYVRSLSSKEYSFGMSKFQGASATDIDLTKDEEIKCIIRTTSGFKTQNYSNNLQDSNTQQNINNKNNLNNKKNIYNDNDLDIYRYLSVYMKELVIIKDDDYENNYMSNKNIIFTLRLHSNGYYTLINDEFNTYIKVIETKEIVNEKNLTDGCYFKLTKVDINNKTFYKFESVVFPKYFLTSGQPIVISNNSSKAQLWNMIDISVPDEVSDSTEKLNEEINNNLLDKILNNLNQQRFNYFTVLAQIEFLKELKEQIKLKQQVIIDLIYKNYENGKIDINQNVFNSIVDSIKNEFNVQEEQLIDNKINELETESLGLKKKLNFNKKMDNIFTILNEAIANKRYQITALNNVFKKVNSNNNILNKKIKVLDEKENKIDEILITSEKNNESSIKLFKTYKNNYYVYFIVIIIAILLILYLLYRLVNRIKELL
jgi:hypothetical protein